MEKIILVALFMAAVSGLVFEYATRPQPDSNSQPELMVLTCDDVEVAHRIDGTIYITIKERQ